MCIIESIGYSEKNKMIYCTECIIFRKTGKCEYLKYIESKIRVGLTKDPHPGIMADDCGF
ncbi:hypothetical protein [Methanolobus halotolerans]|uniref:Uncharacterized protein n=1 Tax=Methanolobus halotolerans TaxID=2052935 RepID=A0A4E0Q375_9EURY|nr:hypothetical protein [Methanolobus halotolerans]TGC07474.1 hypothetical protein CUN85_10805 [Methanolobus halotolerans]